MHRKRTLRLGFLVMLAVLLSAVFCFAELANDYETSRYDVRAQVSADHVIHMEETIRVDFNQSQHHGITRYIPIEARAYTIENIETPGFPSKVTDESGFENGETYNYKLIRIGSASQYLTGPQTFKLNYDIVCYKDDSEKEDYFSLDLLPSEWNTPIEATEMILTMPEALEWSSLNIYSGAYGSVEGLGENFRMETEGNTLRIYGKSIPDFSGVTLSGTLPEGYWKDPRNRDYARTILYILLALIPLITFLMWLRFGRDPRVVQTVEFEPPEGMTPAEVGLVYDNMVEDHEMSAMIMYFAYRGYLKIEETDKGKFDLLWIRNPGTEEKPFARELFMGIFDGREKVRLSALPSAYGDQMRKSRNMLFKEYRGANDLNVRAARICRYIAIALSLLPLWMTVGLAGWEAFDWTAFFISPIFLLLPQLIGTLLIINAFDEVRSRRRLRTILQYVLGIVILVVVVSLTTYFATEYVDSDLMVMLALISEGVTIFFTVFMEARTRRGADLFAKVMGFRQFIQDAEYDRLKVLSDEDPEYFFRIMPYAFVMGLSVRWVKKFRDLNVVQPQWLALQDAEKAVASVWFDDMLRSCNTSVSRSVTRSAPVSGEDTGSTSYDRSESRSSGRSRHAGKSHSGGGFGGGGGGAW